MADSVNANVVQGYHCEFVDQVRSDFYCRGCAQVARSLTFTGCCGETFCLGCIEGFHKEGKPCPECGTEDFVILQQKKFQNDIKKLQVYCSLKDRGCPWKGKLEELENHLDPDQDNCLYVDIDCPLKCEERISKNKVEHHKAEECVKRPYVCQHCAFKGTYEEIVNEHLSDCLYVPIDCPNRCGVTFEREYQEDHMKICRLEMVECEFKSLGCEEKITRDELEEHMREQRDRHLRLASTLVLKSKEEFSQEIKELQEKFEAEGKLLEKKLSELAEKLMKKELMINKQEILLEEQKLSMDSQFSISESWQSDMEKKLKEHEKTMKSMKEEHDKKIEGLESEIENSKNNQDTKKLVEEQAEQISELKKSLKEQAEKLKESEEKLKQQEKKIEEMEEGKKKWQDADDRLTKQAQYNEENDTKIKTIEEKLPKLMDMTSYLGNFERTFEMRNFSVEKDRDKHRDWKSPAMYTHLCGYKFCVGLDANGRGGSQGKAIYAELYVMPGEYDSLLKWPAKASFTLELINRRAGGKNAKYSTAMKKWEKPESSYKCLSVFPLTEVNSSYCFLEHSKLDEFLEEDTLKFCTNVILH